MPAISISPVEYTSPHCVALRNADGLFVVDSGTGCIVHMQLDQKKSRCQAIDAFVGVDTCYPVNALDAEQLVRALSVHDPFLHDLRVDYDRLLQLLDMGVSSQAVRILRAVCERLDGWNYWLGCMADLASITGASQATFYRAWNELQCSLLRVDRLTLPGLVRVRVNPWYAWRGSLYMRGPAIERWYSNKIPQQRLDALGGLLADIETSSRAVGVKNFHLGQTPSVEVVTVSVPVEEFE